MKFEFNWANGLREIYVIIYIDGTPNMSDLAERSKVNLDL